MADDPVVVVGAGVSGLLAARRLVDAGHSVVVIDGDTVAGGRLATRLIGGARLDHGAQFMTARSPEFADLMQAWLADGTVYEWCRGFAQPPAEPDGHPRYAAAGGMAELAGTLAEGLVVQLGNPVVAVDRAEALVGLDDGSTMVAAGVVLTPPVPRSLALVDAAGVPLPVEARQALEAVAYEPTLAALALLDQPSEVPPPGGVQLTDGPFSFVADNHAKGISELSAVTLHASAKSPRPGGTSRTPTCWPRCWPRAAVGWAPSRRWPSCNAGGTPARLPSIPSRI